MKVEQAAMLPLLGRDGVSFSIPVYQRPYTWGPEQLETLWQDALQAAESGAPHFTGTVFFAPSATGELSIIDGQQRMMTIYLMISALATTLEADPDASAALDVEAIRRTYLYRGDACKVSAARADRKSVEHIVLGAALPSEDERSEAVLENCSWFLSKMSSSGFCADELWRGLGLLQVISVEAEDGDRAQSIFETLNAKGMPLSECEERFARIHHVQDRGIQRVGASNKVFGD